MSVIIKIKSFFAGNAPSVRAIVAGALSAAGIVFAIAAVCLYSATGVTDFNPELDAGAIAWAAVGAVLGLAGLLVGLIPLRYSHLAVKPLRYVAFLTIFYAFIEFIGSQATYVANVFVAIDGNSFTAGFICTFLFYVLSFGLMLAAGCLSFSGTVQKDSATIISGEVSSDE